MFFSGYKKTVIDIFGGQRGLINCSIVLDILEGQKRQGWVQTVGDPEKQPQKQQKTAEAATSTAKAKYSTNKLVQQKQQKSQTTGKSAQAEASRTNNKEHQIAATQEKSTRRISRQQTATKTAEAAAETRGPRKVGPRRSLCALTGVFSWNFDCVFEAFFEIPVNFYDN